MKANLHPDHKKKYRLFFKGVLPLMTSLVLAGCSQSVELAKQTFPMELGADVYANPNLYVKDAEDQDLSHMEVICKTPGIVKTENRFMSSGHSYLVSGEYDFVLKDGESETPFVIKVKDTTAPVSRNNPVEVSTTIGIMPDWAELFDAQDLSGVYYSAPSNIVDERGESDVDVTISDRFGNSTTKTIHLIVG